MMQILVGGTAPPRLGRRLSTKKERSCYFSLKSAIDSSAMSSPHPFPPDRSNDRSTDGSTVRPLAPAPLIGVFDSGSGGLSVLAALQRRLPEDALLYIGDLAFAPYGERETAAVIERSQRVVEWLVDQRATLIVVACNTATVLAIGAMRERWPAIAFVGVEPGVKPAAAVTRTGRIAVMATPATAASARLRYLVEAYGSGVHVHIAPCPGLASAIEAGAVDFASLQAVLETPCAGIRAAEVDTVVLGCTHYPFIAPVIQQLLGDKVSLIDTATAVAERVAVVRGSALPTAASVRVTSTGASTEMARLLRRCAAFDGIEIEGVSI